MQVPTPRQFRPSLRQGIRLLTASKFVAFPLLPMGGFWLLHGVGLVVFAVVSLVLHLALQVWETSLRRQFIRESVLPRFIGAKLRAQYPQLGHSH